MNQIQKAYSFIWTLYFLQSMLFIYTWNIPGGIFGIVIILMSIIFRNELYISSRCKWQYAILLIGVVCFCFNYEIDNWLYAINILALPVCVFFLLKTPESYRANLILYIRNIFYFLLLPSLPLFLLHIAGITIFNIGHVEHDLYRGYNCVFYFYQPEYGIRYNSYFCEPGHLGMILSFLLFANRFDFKDRKNLYLLINLFFTLSLAAYVLCFLGFIIYRINLGKLKISSLIKSFVLLLSIIIIGMSIPTIRELIFERLVYNSETGTIAGDNRINWEAKVFFTNITIDDFLYGIGTKKMNSLGIAGTGYFIHVISHGFISILFIIFYYLAILFRQRLNLLNVSLFTIYAISFYQRSYALWASELLLFICVVTSLNKNGIQFFGNRS